MKLAKKINTNQIDSCNCASNLEECLSCANDQHDEHCQRYFSDCAGQIGYENSYNQAVSDILQLLKERKGK